jgi:chitin synthase
MATPSSTTPSQSDFSVFAQIIPNINSHYSAATCDPNDIKDDDFTLRQVHYDPLRHTELFIDMTMYHEDEELFTRSMHGVIKNVAHLCKRDRSKTWGQDERKKLAVCTISDGRAKVNLRTLSVIAAMGCYQVIKKAFQRQRSEKETSLVISMSIPPRSPSDRNLRQERRSRSSHLLSQGEEPEKKINSHRWFFNAFGPIRQSNICVSFSTSNIHILSLEGISIPTSAAPAARSSL